MTGMDIAENTIEAALRQLIELPNPVSSCHVEAGSDSTDDRAVWVWAMRAMPCQMCKSFSPLTFGRLS